MYDTPPWGEPPPGLAEPPRYANAAACVRGDLAPLDLLRLCKRIEVAAGRDLDAPRNAPRVLDLDVLLVGDLELATDVLEVPHPRMHLRAFVLVPLAEIAPDVRHPATRPHRARATRRRRRLRGRGGRVAAGTRVVAVRPQP